MLEIDRPTDYDGDGNDGRSNNYYCDNLDDVKPTRVRSPSMVIVSLAGHSVHWWEVDLKESVFTLSKMSLWLMIPKYSPFQYQQCDTLSAVR